MLTRTAERAPMLRLSDSTPVAVGKLRMVFEHPDRADVLVKVIRSDSAERRWTGRRAWLKRLPRARHYVGYLREIKEYVAALARSPEANPPIARMIGLVETDLGLGLVCEKVVAPDGSLAPTLAAVYERERGFSDALKVALDEFLAGILSSNVIVGDLHAWNLVYGSDSRGGPRIVMIDGFGEKHAIPLSSMSRPYNRYRTRRKFARMLDQLARLVPIGDE